MFSFKSLAVAAGIAFAAISSVAAAPATPAVPSVPDVPATSTLTSEVTTATYTYVQEKSIYNVLEKTKYEVTPVVQKFRK